MFTKRLPALPCALMVLQFAAPVFTTAYAAEAAKAVPESSGVTNKESATGDVAKKEAAKGDVGSRQATKGDVAKADAARKKPLQRCDQLNDKAEIECLQKARERVVEARGKRIASGKGEETYVGKDAPQDASAKDPARKAGSGK